MYLSLLLLIVLIKFLLQARLRVDKNKFLVIILGDLGRSPRMQAHVSSLLARGFQVHVLTYKESSNLSSQISGRIQLHSISHVRGSFIRRVLVQTVQMAYVTLFRLSTVKTILIQVS